MDLEVETPVSNWDDARAGKNGVSVMCVMDIDTGVYSFYGGETLETGAVHLENSDCLVTFNGKGFDIPCLEGVLGRNLRLKSQYDILEEIWAAMETEKVKGTGLGPTCERTLGITKLQTGTKAPELYQQGRFPELYSYCLHDVYLTFMLFTHIVANGFVIGPDGDKICLRTYEDMLIG